MIALGAHADYCSWVCCGVGVVGARLDVRLRRQKCMAVGTLGNAQVSALGSSEASAPRRF